MTEDPPVSKASNRKSRFLSAALRASQTEIAEQIGALPDLATEAGQAYVMNERSRLQPGTLVYILRQLHELRVHQEPSTACFLTLIGSDEQPPLSHHGERVRRVMERVANRPYPLDGAYDKDDFLQDATMNVIAAAFDGRDPHSDWVWRFFGKLMWKLQDLRKWAVGIENKRGFTGRLTRDKDQINARVRWSYDPVDQNWADTSRVLEDIIHSQAGAALAAALSRLPDKERDVMQLLMQHTVTDAAKLLGISRPTLYVLKERATANLMLDVGFRRAVSIMDDDYARGPDPDPSPHTRSKDA